ncbi:hypothetical protein WJX84_009754 [Apatococcus fuscideae]|uniref:Uncharacterized protein n=1 Tax=Apatococcus fuscideae TaxID=2026836 RepID=A0AAW1S7W4_9CHLO
MFHASEFGLAAAFSNQLSWTSWLVSPPYCVALGLTMLEYFLEASFEAGWKSGWCRWPGLIMLVTGEAIRKTGMCDTPSWLSGLANLGIWHAAAACKSHLPCCNPHCGLEILTATSFFGILGSAATPGSTFFLGPLPFRSSAVPGTNNSQAEAIDAGSWCQPVRIAASLYAEDPSSSNDWVVRKRRGSWGAGMGKEPLHVSLLAKSHKLQQADR